MHALSPKSVKNGGQSPEAIVEIMDRRVSDCPDRTAYRFFPDSGCDELVVTRSELARRAHATEAWLVTAGCTGRPALLRVPPGVDCPAAFGTLRAGAIAIPANPSRNSESLLRMQGIAADADPALVLAMAAFESKLAGAAEQSQTIRALKIATIALKKEQLLPTETLSDERAVSSGAPKLA